MVREDNDWREGDKRGDECVPSGVRKERAWVGLESQTGFIVFEDEGPEPISEVKVGAGSSAKKRQKTEVKICVKIMK